jgi:hypothetical protein
MTVTETTPAPPGDNGSPGAGPPGPRHRDPGNPEPARDLVCPGGAK